MSKTITPLCLFVFGIILDVSANHLDWYKSIGSNLDDFSMSIAYDSLNDRVYISGIFDSIIRPNDTIGMPFLDAYSSTGSFLWRTKITGSNRSDFISNGDWLAEPHKIVIDKFGCIYI
jgi:hypothetical protein